MSAKLQFVKDFQFKFGLVPDGIPGPKTYGVLSALELKTENQSSQSAGRSISKTGIDLIKHFEGLYLTAYLCPSNVWTIGYGHTGIKHNDGTVKKGRKVTKEEAEKLLEFDLNTKYIPDVLKYVKVNINQNQLDSLVSFHFNTGGLGKSTLLKKLNAGDFSGASAQFPLWNKSNGKVLSGLVRRRNAERELFDGGDWTKYKS